MRRIRQQFLAQTTHLVTIFWSYAAHIQKIQNGEYKSQTQKTNCICPVQQPRLCKKTLRRISHVTGGPFQYAICPLEEKGIQYIVLHCKKLFMWKPRSFY